jgi:hypothetical protein
MKAVVVTTPHFALVMTPTAAGRWSVPNRCREAIVLVGGEVFRTGWDPADPSEVDVVLAVEEATGLRLVPPRP